MTDAEKPLDENAVIAKYKDLQTECNSLINKVTELEADRNEHRYVTSLRIIRCVRILHL